MPTGAAFASGAAGFWLKTVHGGPDSTAAGAAGPATTALCGGGFIAIFGAAPSDWLEDFGGGPAGEVGIDLASMPFFANGPSGSVRTFF